MFFLYEYDDPHSSSKLCQTMHIICCHEKHGINWNIKVNCSRKYIGVGLRNNAINDGKNDLEHGKLRNYHGMQHTTRNINVIGIRRDEKTVATQTWQCDATRR